MQRATAGERRPAAELSRAVQGSMRETREAIIVGTFFCSLASCRHFLPLGLSTQNRRLRCLRQMRTLR